MAEETYTKIFNAADVNAGELVTPSTIYEYGDYIFGQLAYDEKIPTFENDSKYGNSIASTVMFVENNLIKYIVLPTQLPGIIASSPIQFDGFYELSDQGKIMTFPRYRTMLINLKHSNMPYVYFMKIVKPKKENRANN